MCRQPEKDGVSTVMPFLFFLFPLNRPAVYYWIDRRANRSQPDILDNIIPTTHYLRAQGGNLVAKH